MPIRKSFYASGVLTGEKPLCPCHGEPMYRNGPSWRCAVKHRANAAARYERIKADPEKCEERRAKQRERWPKRMSDPLYRFQRSLNEMVRVRY